MILENIKRLCKENGISIWALEKELGIGNGAIAKWSTASPRVENVKSVADFFGVTVDELLSESGKEDETSETA